MQAEIEFRPSADVMREAEDEALWRVDVEPHRGGYRILGSREEPIFVRDRQVLAQIREQIEGLLNAPS